MGSLIFSSIFLKKSLLEDSLNFEQTQILDQRDLLWPVDLRLPAVSPNLKKRATLFSFFLKTPPPPKPSYLLEVDCDFYHTS